MVGGLLAYLGFGFVGKRGRGFFHVFLTNILVLLSFTMCTRRGAIANGICSMSNRPVVKTDMIVRNAARKAVASVSNTFRLGTRPSRALIIDFLKCGSIVLPVKGGGGFGIALRRSSGGLSRIIIIKCTARGGIGLANSITSISSGSVRSVPMTGATALLRNHLPNLMLARGNTRTNGSGPRVEVHNVNAFNGGGPVMLVSNIRNDLSRVSRVPSTSVSGVSMLGSTTSTTVCNMHTTGNIVLVAAGQKRTSDEIGMSCSKDCALRAPNVIPSCMSDCG